MAVAKKKVVPKKKSSSEPKKREISLEQDIDLIKHYDSMDEVLLKSSLSLLHIQKELVPIGISLSEAIKTNVTNPHLKPFFENLTARFNLIFHRIERIEDSIKNMGYRRVKE